MPIANNRFLVENGTVRDDGGPARPQPQGIPRLAAELEKPVVATGDVHFLDPKDEIYRRILQAAKKFSDADRENPLYYRTTEEMLEEFAYLGQRTCSRGRHHEPERASPTCVEEIRAAARRTSSRRRSRTRPSILKDLRIRRACTSIYGENPPEIVTKRVETELGDILSPALRRHLHVGAEARRGLERARLPRSAAEAASAPPSWRIMSGITEVNSLPPHYVCPKCHHTDFESGAGYGCGADMPDKTAPSAATKMRKEGFDIPFETFLGFGGDKVPDIDLNFSGEYQAQCA